MGIFLGSQIDWVVVLLSRNTQSWYSLNEIKVCSACIVPSKDNVLNCSCSIHVEALSL